jgi:hypothetical protein
LARELVQNFIQSDYEHKIAMDFSQIASESNSVVGNWIESMFNTSSNITLEQKTNSEKGEDVYNLKDIDFNRPLGYSLSFIVIKSHHGSLGLGSQSFHGRISQQVAPSERLLVSSFKKDERKKAAGIYLKLSKFIEIS